MFVKERRKAKSWEDLPDEEILQMRVRDLNVQITGSPLEPLIQRLYEELDAKAIRFHPPCYLADEWFCPDKDPIIGIPFYLAQPHLKHIEQKMMFEVEGGTQESFMKLLRHECGHAFNYAHELYKKTRWRELFGPFTVKYSDTYYFQPYSRRYVTHLEDNYAQAHPDEDFAETFAVWLTPDSRWEQKYQVWPVIAKLRYIDGLMKRIRDHKPIITAPRHPPWSASRMTSTLAAYYERKRRALGSQFRGYYDDSLARLFSIKDSNNQNSKASSLLRSNRRILVDNVAKWTGHRKYDIHQLVSRIIQRCDALKLYTPTTETDSIIAAAVLLTAIAGNTLRVSRKRQHQ